MKEIVNVCYCYRRQLNCYNVPTLQFSIGPSSFKKNVVSSVILKILKLAARMASKEKE